MLPVRSSAAPAYAGPYASERLAKSCARSASTSGTGARLPMAAGRLAVAAATGVTMTVAGARASIVVAAAVVQTTAVLRLGHGASEQRCQCHERSSEERGTHAPSEHDPR